MKINCGETWEEAAERISNWHRHFALIPRRVGTKDCRWLEIIERRVSWGMPEYAPLGTHLSENENE
jgi:hypothetical protein